LVGGSGSGPKSRRRGVAWAVKYSNFACLFQSFSANNFCYEGMDVQQLLFAVVWSQIRRKYY